MESIGKLYGFYDPEEMRDFFRKKSKKMFNKVTSLKKYITENLKDGDYITAGHSAIERTPVAALMELLKELRVKPRKNLKYGAMGGGFSTIFIFSSNLFKACDVSYTAGLEALGIPRIIRKRFETGEIKVTEWTNATLSWRVKAAGMGLPFLPARDLLTTDTKKYSASKEIMCPFTSKKYAAIPALYPDIAFIHVHAADIYGNCYIKGTVCADVDMAKASKKVVITTERLVPTDFFRDNPQNTTIPFYLVDAVVEVPFGAHPGGMPFEYAMDVEFLKYMIKMFENENSFNDFMEKYIYGCNDFIEFIELCGGINYINKLRHKALQIKTFEEE
ncbi:MAG: CoA transferase subunit A [Desulfurella sp.]|uniref:CoA transferase subunit A n=1 Tax=Desulfurella sp. TaxID=1962857 RepID=UPI000CC129E5|nr:CoA-transferase [Desulfurella sp.]PMP89293.1 MAG: CoA transferase subunit A [Desulfurella sp.]